MISNGCHGDGKGCRSTHALSLSSLTWLSPGSVSVDPMGSMSSLLCHRGHLLICYSTLNGRQGLGLRRNALDTAKDLESAHGDCLAPCGLPLLS